MASPTAGTAKYSVSMPRDIAEEARRRGGPSGLSAFVTAAVTRAVEVERLRELVAAAEADHGPVTEEEIQAAERELDLAHAAMRSRRHGVA
ncbi:MAG: hypothetical protein ACRCZD_16760 [Phycicoccus sp.]